MVCQRREERLKREKRGWGIIWTPSIVSRGGGGGGVESGGMGYSEVRAYIYYVKFYRKGRDR